jgi:putative heme-binding domain-containing protein
LHGADKLEESTLDDLVRDKEPTLRAWAARLTGEQRVVSEPSLARLHTLARDDNASVRLAAAVAVRQFVSGSLTVDTPGPSERPDIGGILVELIEASVDGKDPLLPFMIWMASEPGFAHSPQAGLDWLAQNGSSTLPLSAILIRKGMRRLSDTQDAEKLGNAVEFLNRIVDEKQELIMAALDGLIEGQKAKPLVPGVDTTRLFESLGKSRHAAVKERAQELGTLWGNAPSIRGILTAITDASLPVDQRTRAIQTAKLLKNDAAREALLQLLDSKTPEPLTIEAIRALGEVGGDEVADDLLKPWKAFAPGPKNAAAEVLASRRRWAIALLSAIESKTIPASDLPLTVVRSLGESKDDFVRQRALQAIGRVRPANADKQKLIEQKKQLILSGGAPDMQAGHELVKKTCLVCHKFYGEGAEVGPDLTGVGRANLDALLANVIDPNLVVGKGYENVEVETKDGRSVSGRLVENTDTRIKLLSSGPKEEIVAKADIASMRVSELSVMPEGLEQMPDSDFRNLILYVLRPPQEQTLK